MKRHGSMNHIFRLVWSHVTNSWVAVAENARGRGKSSKRKLVAAALSLTAIAAQAGPTGGQVTAGNGSVTQSSTTTTVNQSSQNLSLNWTSFNIAPQETVNFVQPSASAIAINRIFDTNGSQILGHLNANGQVFLINPNGVLFGAGAQVNVGGLVASTLDVNDSSLGGNTRTFSGTGSGSVVNAGTITATNGGYVALLGNHVSNQGTIKAQLGTVALGGGSAVTLTFDNNRLLHLQVDQSVLNSLAQNGGLMQSDGGQVILTAGARDSLLASVVNNTGVIEARAVENHNGTITLLGGMSAGSVNVAGTLDASATSGNGGTIETSAANVKVGNSAVITTSAPQGKAGTWTIDPTDFTIAPSGGDITGTLLSSALTSGSVNIVSTGGASGTSGNVNVNDAVSWNANRLTLNAQNNININANLNGSGTASLALQYGQGAAPTGNTSTYNLANGVQVNLPAGQNFSTQLGAGGTVKNYTVITSLGFAGSTTGADLQGMNVATGNYVLGANVDASPTSGWNSGAGFAPIPSFSGTFDGLGHTISNLSINTPNSTGVALFSSNSGKIQNVGLTGTAILGKTLTGALVGTNNGSIINSYEQGSVTGFEVGGLVGYNLGSINSSYSSGTVTATGTGNGGVTASNAAGLVGYNTGTISYSNSSAAINGNSSSNVGGLVGQNVAGGVINNSYATGNVIGGATLVGGLAGANSSVITNSYASGIVSGGASSTDVGGLVGMAEGGSISNSYATGSVSGTNGVGGLVGALFTGSVLNSYSTSNVFGTTQVGGLAGSVQASTSISTSYSSGNVKGTTQVGGVTGKNLGTLTNTYWNTTQETTGVGTGTVTGATGLTATQMQTASNFAGFNFTTTPGAAGNNWVLVDRTGSFNNAGGAAGVVLPMLASEYSTSITNTHQLQLMALALGANYVLTQNINAAATSTGGDVWGSAQFVPIGNSTLNSSFSGTLNGQGYTISGLSINATNLTSVALIGQTASTAHIENLGIIGGQVYGVEYVGGLVGLNNGTVSNSYVSGTSVGSQSGIISGGLVGYNNGLISGSHASSNITNSNDTAGGLVGQNAGTISNSYTTGAVSGIGNVGGLVGGNTSSGKIIASYSTANVSANTYAGGLAGDNSGTVSASYATGNVTQTGTNANSQPSPLGGLAGSNEGTIANTYALGNVTSSGSDVGGSQAGGLVGHNVGSISHSYSAGMVSGTTTGGAANGGLVSFNSGSVSNSFWDVTTSGQATSAGGTGMTTAQMQQQADFNSATSANGNVNPAWDFGSIWVMYNGHTYPLLQVFMVPLTVTADSVTTTYNASAYSGGNGAVLSAIPNPGLLLGTLSYSGTSQGAVNAGTYTLAPSGLYSTQQQGGYNINFVSGSLTINPAAVTVSGATVTNKVYDGTTMASFTGGTLSGVVAGDAVSLIQGGTFATKNAGTGIAVTTADLLTGAAASNYVLVQPGGLTGNITPATLTVSGESASGKVYNGSTNATLTGGTLVGVIGGDNVTLTQSGNFASKNVGTGIAVTSTDALGGASAGNYVLAQPTGLTANITPATLTVSGETAANMVYNGGTTATLSGGTLSGVVAGDTVTLTQSGAFPSKNVGTGLTVTAADALGGPSAGNYTLVQPSGLTANITPATLFVNGEIAANKVYDGTTSATLSGGTLSGVVAGDSITLTQAGRFASKNAGIGVQIIATNSIGGADAGNYTLAGNGGILANIAPATLTITGETAVNKVYDGTTNATLTGGTLQGVLAGDSLTLSQTGTFAGKNVGSGLTVTATDTLSGASAGNYVFAQPSGLLANITPAPLTLVGATVANKVYDGTTSATITGGGLVGGVPGETIVYYENGTFATKNAGNGIPVTISINFTSGNASNYSFTPPTGVNANITPATLTVSGESASNKVYDGTTSATLHGGTLTGVIAGDNVTLTQSGSFATKNAGSSIAITASDSLGGSASSNYTLVQPTSLAANITPATLSVTGEVAANKVYDGTTSATLSGGTLSGVIAGDNVSLTQAGSFASKNAGAGVAVNAANTIVGSDAGNYTLAQPTGLAANITPASLSVTGEAASNKVYDGTTGATLSGGTLSGVVAGDVVTLTQAGSFAAKNVGTGVAVTATDTLGGAAAGNYTLVQTTGLAANITPASLSVTGETAANKVYDGTTAASLSGGSLTGVIAGDNVSLIQAGSFASKNAGTGVAVNAANTVSGSDAGNYTLVQPTGLTANITPASLSVTGEAAANKVYDGTTGATLSGGTLTGVIAGDNVNLTQAGSFISKNAGTSVAVNAANTLSGGDAGNYTLTQPTGLAANITPASLIVTGETAANKVYDGTTGATLSGGILSGVIAGDNVNLTQAGSFVSKNAGTGVVVNAANTISGSDSGNYTLTQPTGLAANITPASLTVTGEAAANKVYDGTAGATLSGGTLSGVIAGDNVNLTQAGSFVSKNAGTGVAVNAANSIGGSDAGNYTLAQPTGLTANITPASLTVTGEATANKVYDGTTGATLSGGSLTGVIAGDNVNLTQSGSFVSKNAGTGVAVNAANTISGSDSGNYTLTQPSGLAANITPASLTVTGEAAANKVYDGTTGATLSGGTLSGVIAGDNVNLTQSGTFVSKNAGTSVAVNAANTISGSDSGNYTLTQPTGLAANITPASLTVTGEAAANKVYDGTNGATLSGGTLTGVIAGDNVSLTQAGSFASKNAGAGVAVNATNTINGGDAGNYTLVQPTGLTANITPASLTVTGEAAANKVYDGTTGATLSGGTLTGVIAGDNVNLTQAGSFISKNAGTGVGVNATNTLSGGDAGNYTLTQPTGLAATITPASLSVTGEAAANKVYDGTTGASLSGGTLNGVIAGDSVNLTQAGSFGSKNAGTRVAVSAANTLSGGDAGNYTLTQPTGIAANITPASLTVTGEAVANKVYDGTTGATLSGGTLSGVIAGDVVTLTQSGNFVSKNAGTGVAVNAANTIIGGDAGNYTLTQPAGLSANITPAALTINGETAANKVYNGTTSATLSGGTLSGVIAGDNVTLTQAGSFVSKNAGTGVTVNTSNTINGGDAGNYTLVQPAGLTANITPAALTVTGETAANKVYDGTTGATLSGGTLSGMITGDTLTLTQAGSFASKNAGSAIIVTATDTLGGTSAANYTLVQPTGLTASITPAALTVSGETASNKVYNGNTTAVLTGGTLNGVISGDAVSLTQAGSFASKNVGTGIAVTVSDTLSGTAAANYTLAEPTGVTGNITPATLTVTGETAANKVYNGTTAVTLSGGTLVGVIAGDSVTLTQAGSFATKNAGTGIAVTVNDTIGGIGTSNYTLVEPANVSANITPLAITVTATGSNRVYNGTVADSVTLASSGVIAGDSVTFSDTSANFANKNVGTGKTVTVSGIAIGGANASDYTLSATSATTTANVTPLGITVTATGSNKVYNGNVADAVMLGASGVIAGDSVSFTDTSANFANKNIGTGKTVSVSGITVKGTDAGNYTLLNTTATTTANITPLAITVTATGTDKVYNGNTTDLVTLGSSGIISGDVVSFTDLSATFADKNVGSCKVVTVTGISALGTDAGNYTLKNTTATTTANLTQASLTVSGETAQNKVADGTTTATLTGGKLVGVISGDTVTLNQSGHFATASAGNNIAVTATDTLSGTGAGNYKLVEPTGLQANITKSTGKEEIRVTPAKGE